MSEGWFEQVASQSDAGRLALEVDWAATSLGAPATWPRALRVAVELCLGTRFPVLVAWGPDLIKVYNDGYRQMLGSDKHPAAMGAPAADVWREIWDVIGPVFQRVLETGEPSWVVDQRLVINRSGFDEEAFFTYSYSPLRDDDGVVRGVLDIAAETTDQVVDRRRLRCLADLGAALQGAGDDGEDVIAAGLEVLATSGAADVASAAVELGSGATAGRGGDRRIVVPLVGPGEVELGVLLLELSPHRPVDDAAREFAALVGAAVGAALAAAEQRRQEVEQLRIVSTRLQRSMLPDLSGLASVAVRYLPATDELMIGGDWYDAIELGDGRLAVLVGDCVGHGLHAATLMGGLRSASRALLLGDHRPASVIESLDRFARSLPGAIGTTVAYAVVDEVEGTITYSSAGHPPALVLDDEGTRWLSGPVDVPLGVSTDRRRREHVEALGSTAALVLYTDGLVERRSEPLETGLARLAAALADIGPRCAAQIADRILDALPSDRADDVAVLVHTRDRGARSLSSPGRGR